MNLISLPINPAGNSQPIIFAPVSGKKIVSADGYQLRAAGITAFSTATLIDNADDAILYNVAVYGCIPGLSPTEIDGSRLLVTLTGGDIIPLYPNVFSNDGTNALVGFDYKGLYCRHLVFQNNASVIGQAFVQGYKLTLEDI